jgi:hypothetical protein
VKSCYTFVILALLASMAPPALGAGSVDAGRALFFSTSRQNCVSCHIDPPTAPRFVKYQFNPDGLGLAFRIFMPINVDLISQPFALDDLTTFFGLPNGNDTDRLLDWGEDTFPQLLSPRRQPTQQLAGYSYRFYSATGVYVATKDGSVWFFNGAAPGAGIVNLGTMRSFLGQMPTGR